MLLWLNAYDCLDSELSLFRLYRYVGAHRNVHIPILGSYNISWLTPLLWEGYEIELICRATIPIIEKRVHTRLPRVKPQ